MDLSEIRVESGISEAKEMERRRVPVRGYVVCLEYTDSGEFVCFGHLNTGGFEKKWNKPVYSKT